MNTKIYNKADFEALLTTSVTKTSQLNTGNDLLIRSAYFSAFEKGGEYQAQALINSGLSEGLKEALTFFFRKVLPYKISKTNEFTFCSKKLKRVLKHRESVENYGLLLSIPKNLKNLLNSLNTEETKEMSEDEKAKALQDSTKKQVEALAKKAEKAITGDPDKLVTPLTAKDQLQALINGGYKIADLQAALNELRGLEND